MWSPARRAARPAGRPRRPLAPPRHPRTLLGPCSWYCYSHAGIGYRGQIGSSRRRSSQKCIAPIRSGNCAAAVVAIVCETAARALPPRLFVIGIYLFSCLDHVLGIVTATQASVTEDSSAVVILAVVAHRKSVLPQSGPVIAGRPSSLRSCETRRRREFLPVGFVLLLLLLDHSTWFVTGRCVSIGYRHLGPLCFRQEEPRPFARIFGPQSGPVIARQPSSQ